MQTTMPRVQVMKNRDARRKKVQWCDDVQIGEASTLVSGMLSINEKKRLWLQQREYDKIIQNNNQLLEPLRNVKGYRASAIEWESYERKYSKGDHSLRGLELSQGILAGDYREKMRDALVHAVLYAQLNGDSREEGLSKVSRTLSREAYDCAVTTAEKDYQVIKKDAQVQFYLQQQKQAPDQRKSRKQMLSSMSRNMANSFRIKNKVSVYPRSNSIA